MKEKKHYTFEIDNTEAKIERIHNLFKKNGNPKSIEHLRWQYLDTPNGSTTCFALTADGDDAAVYSVFQAPMKCGMDSFVGAQSLDTLTDRDHRGQGLFTSMARLAYAECEKKGALLIYGFPNSSSAPGFFTKLDWKEHNHPTFCVVPLNITYPLNRVIGRRSRLPNIFHTLYLKFVKKKLTTKLQTTATTEPGWKTEQYDPLWRLFSGDLGNTIDRTSQYMQWRYDKKPNRQYLHKSIHKNNALLATVTYFVTEKHGGTIGYIMDLVFHPNHPDAGTLALAEALIHLSELKTDVVLAWADLSNSAFRPFKSAGFINLPRVLQPIKLHFGTRWLGKKSRNEPEESKAFFYNYTDSDTV